MTVLHIDFETYSACELRDRGLHNYATDPTTGVHCMAFAFEDQPVGLFDGAGLYVRVEEWREQPDLMRVINHVYDGGIVYAHNAAFELAIWNNICVPRYGWPPLKPEQVRCTMAMCYAMGLPGALENAAPALGLAQRKDAAGKRVMLQLAKPKTDGEFWTSETAPEKFEQLYAYCKQDVEVERALHHRLMELSENEQRIWQLDYRINQRGIRVDLESIDKAIALVEQEKRRLDAEMLRVTGGVVGKCTEVQLLVKWIRSQGVEIKGLAKADVLDALQGDLPPAVEAALRLRKEAAKSSTAKLIAMKERASADGRVRGTKQFHGAATGRWAGRGMQTDNYPRGFLKPHEVNDAIEHLHQRDYLDMMYGPPMDVVSSCLRGLIEAADGHDFVACDFSNIEGRVLPWLAGEERKLQAFREFDAGRGPDIYLLNVSEGRGISVVEAKPFRQEGKVEELAFQFGGGKGAMATWCVTFGMVMSDEVKEERKNKWRARHPKIVRYWYALEEAAIRALTEGGVQSVGPRGREVKFRKAGSFLWLQLPSKRVLCYPYPELRVVETPWGEPKEALTYMTELDSTTRKKLGNKVLPDPNANGNWCRISTYGGSLAENVTQAVAADLLRYSMETLESTGYPVVMHVHDEAVVEIPSSCDDRTLERVEELMARTPEWAAGLPVSAEGWRAKRYRK